MDRMRWNAIWQRTAALLFVPQCVCCGERLPHTEPNAVLCPICRAAYEDAKEHTCPVCAARLGTCLCVPSRPKQNGVRQMAKLFCYRPGRGDLPENRLIYALKHENLRPLQAFFARELARTLAGQVDLGRGEWCVSYPPRTQAALRRYGFDHAKEMAKLLAAECGLPFAETLVRVAGGQQKKLDRQGRLENAEQSFCLARNTDLSGRRVLLVDDIATTGATLAAASRLLRQAGAVKVVCAVLAVTL